MTVRPTRAAPGAAIEEFAATKYCTRFHSIQAIRLPRPLYTLRRLLVLGAVVSIGFLACVPWVQNASGTGSVTTLHPAMGIQTINALVKGRISHWYVGEGSYVRAGDPVVDLVDLDFRLLERLDAQLRAFRAAAEAAQEATRIAGLNLQRQQRLFDQGLSSRLALEAASIRRQELLARESEAQAALNRALVGASRARTQQVTAPANGTVIRIRAGAMATLVNEGEAIAEFVPDGAEAAVEIFLSGLDASLVTEGRTARIMFEGWPAVQFGGWPGVAIGTFGATVVRVDPVVSSNGRFRILLTPDPAEPPWPSQRYLRFGSQARGWILLDTVPIGYELWRRLNGFPPVNNEGAGQR
jgi:biotin carboxyl carrier protein